MNEINGMNSTCYTPQELAVRWKTNVDKIYAQLNLGELQGFKLGRDWRITASEVERFETRPAKGQIRVSGGRGRKLCAMKVV